MVQRAITHVSRELINGSSLSGLSGLSGWSRCSAGLYAVGLPVGRADPMINKSAPLLHTRHAALCTADPVVGAGAGSWELGAGSWAVSWCLLNRELQFQARIYYGVLNTSQASASSNARWKVERALLSGGSMYSNSSTLASCLCCPQPGP
jgi:hypothetical protein